MATALKSKSSTQTTKEEFVWTIDNFSTLSQKPNERLEKILISTSPSGNPLKWSLGIYPNGYRLYSKDEVCSDIRLVDFVADEVSAKIEYSIRDYHGFDKIKVYRNDKFTKNHRDSGLYIKPILLCKKKDILLPDDRFTIEFEITVQQEIEESAADINLPECRQIFENIGELFERSLFTDCRIIASGNEEFKVHKCILASRSPVFAAMFENPMVEAQQGIVKIEDIQSEVLEQILRFIYNGMAPKLKEMAEELLAAADKYELNRLKGLCENELAISMTVENVCELFVLANRHSAEHLEAKAIEYIKEHANEVIESGGWAMLMKGNNTKLIGELKKVAFQAGNK